MKGEYLGVEVTKEDVEILEKAQEIMANHHIYSVHMQMLIGRLRSSLGTRINTINTENEKANKDG